MNGAICKKYFVYCIKLKRQTMGEVIEKLVKRGYTKDEAEFIAETIKESIK